MRDKKFWLGILVMVMVFGITVIGCEEEEENGGNDPALNGTWVRNIDNLELTLNNGNWEGRYSGISTEKGTYTANNGKMTMTTTHCWVDAKWYTKSEYQSAYPSYDSSPLYREYTWTYSVSGNTFTRTRTLDDGSSYTQTYTKK